MKEDFELITLYLQEQHKRLYVDRKHSEGMRDSEMEIGPKTYNVYEAAMEMGCTQEAIRKAIRDGRLRAFVPKGQKTYMITDSAWQEFKTNKLHHRFRCSA